MCARSLKGLVEGRSVMDSLLRYKEDAWENCKALWMVWVPAQMGESEAQRYIVPCYAHVHVHRKILHDY